MKYSIDIKLTGYETVVVEAKSKKKALEKAESDFWEIYNVTPASSLRWKSTEATILNED